MVDDVVNLEPTVLFKKYAFEETKDWKLIDKREFFLDVEDNDIREVVYRPFDNRFTYYPYSKISQIIPRGDSRKGLMKNLLDSNFGIVLGRQGQVVGSMPWNLVFMIDTLTDLNVYYRGGGVVSPLYLYPEENTQTELLESKDECKPTRTPNLDLEIVENIAKAIGLTFTNEKEATAGTFAPIDILDYIYAVLHSPTYRETYKEFLKIDFPRVPYPSDADTFWQLVTLGGELRQIHLLESPRLAAQIKALSLGYPIGGDNSVTRKMTKTSVGFEPDEADSSMGKVWLNDTQYFTNVPLVAWEFYIGGYQPAQKWLKDRRDRTLDHHDIKHYRNIIASLSLTNELMQQIDTINVVG